MAEVFFLFEPAFLLVGAFAEVADLAGALPDLAFFATTGALPDLAFFATAGAFLVEREAVFLLERAGAFAVAALLLRPEEVDLPAFSLATSLPQAF